MSGGRGSGPLALIVPCYNEEQRLDTSAFQRFARQHPDVHLVFVDDGSTDGTASVLGRLVDADPARVSILRLEPNRGKAEAVRRGVLEALAHGPALVGFWDADLATPLDAVRDLLAVLEAHPEVELAMGSRVRLLGRDIRRSALRHYLGRIFATVASAVLRLPVYDTQCGAKLFRVTEAVCRVFDRPFVSRWIFDVEILARLDQAHRASGEALEGRVHEVPLRAWTDVEGSKLRPRDFLRVLVDLVAIRRTYRP